MKKALLRLALAGAIGGAVANPLGAWAVEGGKQGQSPWWMPKGWSVLFFGVSYHLREDVREAPRKIDSNGRAVFNPGVGIMAEWLKSPFESGFRPIVEIGWFQDCMDKSMYHANVGLKYRYITEGGWSFGFTVGGGAYYGKDWDEGKYHWTTLPIAFISLGHTFHLGNKKILPEINVTYVPENNDISGTADTDLIFTFLSLAF